jgi:hypothetical protein
MTTTRKASQLQTNGLLADNDIRNVRCAYTAVVKGAAPTVGERVRIGRRTVTVLEVLDGGTAHIHLVRF